MEQAQKDIQTAIEKTKQQVVELANEATTDIKSVDPKEWGVAAGIGILLSLILNIATKQSEDSVFTIGVVVYGLIAAVLAVILRKKPINDQFPLMVIIFSVLRLFIEVSALSVIVLSASPVVVNLVNTEVQKQLNKGSSPSVKLPSVPSPK